MAGFQIERYGRSGPRSKRRISNAQLGCGCTLATGFIMLFTCVGLYAAGLLTPILLQVAGVQRIGDTDNQFMAQAAITRAPTPQNGQTQPRAIFDLGSQGREIVDVNSRDYTIITGEDDNLSRVATASFSEAGLLDLCARRSAVCRNGNDQFRNARFDLRPGGVVIYVEVNAGLLWQQIGMVLRLSSDRTRFEVVGVDIDGSTYSITTLPAFIPAETRQTINTAVNDIQVVGNQVLDDLVLLAGGEDYRLTDITIDDTLLTLTLRG